MQVHGSHPKRNYADLTPLLRMLPHRYILDKGEQTWRIALSGFRPVGGFFTKKTHADRSVSPALGLPRCHCSGLRYPVYYMLAVLPQ